MSTIIIYNESHSLHKLSTKPHPQRPQRITSILDCLKDSSYKNIIFTYQQVLTQNQQIDNSMIQKITEEQIGKIHGKRYYQFVEGMWCQGLSRPQMFINVDTFYMKQTFKAAFEAAKTSILMIQYGLKHKNNVFSLIRPPGHHSGLKIQPHGFSFFNNVALAANYFVQTTKKKAVIIDWDIHHGQGTQKIFYQRNDILYLSLHRFDEGKFFPHIKQSGPQFIGQKQGKGFNINIAWNFPKKEKNQKRQQHQTVRNQEYLYCFKEIVLPILKQYEFQAIFISCGFDGACGDSIGDSRITQKGFKMMTKLLTSMNKQIFIVLQGGYNLECLQKSTLAVLEGLNKFEEEQKNQIKFQELNKFAQIDIEKTLQNVKSYWKIN